MDTTITAYFANAGLPALGLTPTIRIWSINVGSPQADSLIIGGSPPPSMTEVGDGFYKYTFTAYDPRVDYTFRADGGVTLSDSDRYAIGATECADPVEVWDVAVGDATTTTGSIGKSIDDNQTTIITNQTTMIGNQGTIVANQATMTALLNTLLQYECGRSVINGTLNTLTIYESDCVTPLKVFELRDSTGTPSVTEVCERFPVGPGSPSCTP